jgi:hypothetical protein
MVADDRLLAELFSLVLGIALAEARLLPGVADVADTSLHRAVALAGLDEPAIHSQAAHLVAIAGETLAAHGCPAHFPLLRRMLETRQTPAHAMRERFTRTGRLPVEPEPSSAVRNRRAT